MRPGKSDSALRTHVGAHSSPARDPRTPALLNWTARNIRAAHCNDLLSARKLMNLKLKSSAMESVMEKVPPLGICMYHVQPHSRATAFSRSESKSECGMERFSRSRRVWLTKASFAIGPRGSINPSREKKEKEMSDVGRRASYGVYRTHCMSILYLRWPAATHSTRSRTHRSPAYTVYQRRPAHEQLPQNPSVLACAPCKYRHTGSAS